jgi:hypothetical protein
MLKESDLELIIPVGTEVWGEVQHKTLLIYISFPLCRYLAEFCGELRGVWEAVPGRARTHSSAQTFCP